MFHSSIRLMALLLVLVTPTLQAAEGPLNVLLFTADDLNQDSLGCYGSKVPDITPHLDRFASQSMRFTRGHVTVAICQPCRGTLATGMYPHHSTVMGFMKTSKNVTTVMEAFGQGGYMTGILGKVSHSTPEAGYTWDYQADQPQLGAGRSPTKYYEHSTAFFAQAKATGQPFYFMVNSHDPHRPYHIPGSSSKKLKGAEEPSRLYSPDEIVVPGFLPDLPNVRLELSYYFNSVKRMDDTFGRVMEALEESGQADNTLVLFITDNGIAMPFGKCNAYLAASRSPWIVRWPGVVKGGSVNETDFVSSIDFMPTALEAAGLAAVEAVDGRSFVPILKGAKQAGRDRVFTQVDCKAGGDAVPIRAIQNNRFAYIFNSWADGEHRYRNNNEGMVMKAMEAAAEAGDAAIAERVRVFRWRDVEEFYDLENDPDCLVNLAGNANYQKQLESMRYDLYTHMKEGADPLLRAFEMRENPTAMEDAMMEDYAQYRNGKKKK